MKSASFPFHRLVQKVVTFICMFQNQQTLLVSGTEQSTELSQRTELISNSRSYSNALITQNLYFWPILENQPLANPIISA